MNRNALQYGDNYCAIIDDNGKIRVLEQKNHSNSFDKILELEDNIDICIHNIDKKTKRISKLKKEIILKLLLWGCFIAFFVFNGKILGYVESANIKSMISKLMIFLFGMDSFDLFFNSISYYRKEKRSKVELENHLNDYENELNNIKNDSIVKEKIVIDSFTNGKTNKYDVSAKEDLIILRNAIMRCIDEKNRNLNDVTNRLEKVLSNDKEKISNKAIPFQDLLDNEEKKESFVLKKRLPM